MDPFHDGHHVRLRRSTHASAHHGEGGEVATLCPRRALLEAVYQVGGLHSGAADGGYLAATSSLAPPHPGEGGEVAILCPRRALLEAAYHVGGLHSGSADGRYLAARSSHVPPEEHHVRLRSRAHKESPHPGEGGEFASLGLHRAPVEAPSGRFLTATGAPVPRARQLGGFDDDEPGALPLPAQEYGLRRRRAGEDAKVGFNCGGYEWVLDSRHVHAPAAAGEVVAPHRTDSSNVPDGYGMTERVRGTPDLFIARARNGTLPTRLKVILTVGPRYWFERVLDWSLQNILGLERRRPPSCWSWISVMGEPIINDDGSCVIASCSMCIEAQHRLVFERLHGHGKFCFQAKHPLELKKRCFRKRAWFSDTGAFFPNVLNVIRATQGIPTIKVPNAIRLPLASYTVLDLPANLLMDGKLQPLHLAWLIPLLGGVLLDDDYYLSNEDSSYVYRGIYGKIKSGEIRVLESGELKHVDEDDEVRGHAVVCFAYRFEAGGEMIIHVLDNHREDGPQRWIAFAAFDEFVQVHVKPVDPKLLRKKKRFSKKDLLDPFDYMANKLYFFR